MKKASQREIAERAGVSQALVSLVLNGKREGVAEGTREKIWSAAEGLGYRSRGIGREKAGREVQTIGYVLRDPLRMASTSNFFSEVLEGLDEYLSGNLARTSFLGTESGLSTRPLEAFVEGDPGFRGIVIMGEIGEAAMDTLLQLDCPLVYISARAPGLCHSVNANEAMAASQALDHLVGLGHRRFAYLGSELPHLRSDERHGAFTAAMRRHRKQPELVTQARRPHADRSQGWDMAEELLASAPSLQASAWVCVGGMVARGAMDALKKTGGKASEEIAVVSLDRTQACTVETPTITAAGPEPQALGREAGKLLLKFPGSSPVYHDLALPTQLVIGDSSHPDKS